MLTEVLVRRSKELSQQYISASAEHIISRQTELVFYVNCGDECAAEGFIQLSSQPCLFRSPGIYYGVNKNLWYQP